MKQKVMYDLFRIHDLHKFYIDNTINILSDDKAKKRLIKKVIPHPGEDFYCVRVIEILEYVHKYPHITHFVAIDDMDLSVGLLPHFVHTNNNLTSENAKSAIKILKNIPFTSRCENY
jgi:hypothetical protein